VSETCRCGRNGEAAPTNLDLDERTALVVWHAPDDVDVVDLQDVLSAFTEAVLKVAPNAMVVALGKGQTLEALSEDDVATLGWVRKSAASHAMPESGAPR
jgi:hypothetical protein